MHKLNLVVCPFHDWKKCEKEGFRTRDAHLILEFEKNPLVEKILVVDRPISIPEMILKKGWWRTKEGKIIYKSQGICLTQISEKIFVLDLFSLDILMPLILRKKWWYYIFNQPFVIKAIKFAIGYLQFNNFILFLWNPISSGVIGKLDDKLLVFDAIDNLLAHPELNYAKKEIDQGYRMIKKEADLIFTVSESLKSFFESSRDDVYCIPNGVDVDFFYSFTEMAQDIKNIAHPIIGYAGKIQDRIDVELMGFLSTCLPDVNFVFIGQVINRKTIKLLLQYENVHYLGDKHYSLLPQYLSCFDICIIPHKVSELTSSMNPLKIYEYLAAGRPVVTTNIAGVDVFRDIITIAKTKEEFLNGIERYIQAINQGNDISGKLMKSITPDHYWSTKANKMVDLIIQKMEKKCKL